MFGRTIVRVLGFLLFLGLLTAIGVGIYDLGVSAGAASAGAVGASGAAVAPGYLVPLHVGFGFGWGIFGFFGFLLLLFVIFGLLRLALWGGRGRGWGGGYGPGGYGPGGYGHGGWGRGPWGPKDGPSGDQPRHPAEAAFEEWHRRMHGEPPTGDAPAGSPGASDRSAN